MDGESEETVDTSGMPDLTETMTRMRARGYMPTQIAKELGLSVDEVQHRIREHLLNNYSAEDLAMQRMLMMTRLEGVMNALWDQVMEGDLATEGKQVKNLVDTIERFSKMLDLDKDRAHDELVQLRKAQIDLVHTVLAAVRTELLQRVNAAVQQVPTSGDPEEVKATIREQIDSGFSTWYADAATRALEQADTTVITLDGSTPAEKNHNDGRISE